MLRLILRGRLTRWAFRWLHPDVGAAVARLVSVTESREDLSPEESRGRTEFLERWGLAQLAEDPTLDLVTVGHTHISHQVCTSDGQWFVNTGDWIHERTYLRLALDRNSGHRQDTARVLGVHRNTLKNKLAKYRLAGKNGRNGDS